MDPKQPNHARQLFLDVLDWLRETYSTHRFFTERDLVWTVQKRLLHEGSLRNLQYRVFHDYKMIKGGLKSAPADLVLLDPADRAKLAVEFKYEPDHQRGGTEFPLSKFPVVDWKEVIKDTQRVEAFGRQGFASHAVSLFVDEGRYCRHRMPPPGSRWVDWDIKGRAHRVSVLISEA